MVSPYPHEKFSKYGFIYDSSLYRNSFFNHGACSYTRAFWYITQGFPPSSHMKKIR